MILRQSLAAATARLAEISETPRLDAELLLAYALGVPRAKLLAQVRDSLSPPPEFEDLVRRRLDHEPIAYITGSWEFFSLEFAIRPPILVPRPETEHLVEAALEALAKIEPERAPRVLDLCTGSGCVAIAIAKNAPACQVTATDLNPEALALARENAAQHGADIEFHQGDLFGALPSGTASFDIIVSNPPYVADSEWPSLSPVIRKHEDPRALLAGDEGLDCIRAIVGRARRHLTRNGFLAIEIGDTQRDAVERLLLEADFANPRFRNDLADIPRIAEASRAKGS